MNFTSLLISRLKSEQPEFFKKLQSMALWVLVVIGVLYGLLYLNLLPITPALHDKLNTACYAIGTFVGGVFFTAQTGTKDPTLLSDDTKQAVVDHVQNNNSQP